MKVKKYNIQDLITSEYNPRRITEKQITDLKASILRFGIVDPIIINKNPDRNNIVIGGHQRLRACIDLGHQDIDCVELDLPIEKEKELNIRLNKSGGEFDFHELLKNFTKTEAVEYGFDLKEIEKGMNKEAMHLGKLKGEGGEYRQENKDKLLKKWKVKEGDLWALGEHKLICGDSLDEKTYKKLLGDERVQLMFTDPPYGVSYVDTVGGFEAIENDQLKNEGLYQFLFKFLTCATPYIVDEGSAYIWHAIKTRRIFEDAIKDSKLKELSYVIWIKDSIAVSFQYYRNQFEPAFFVCKEGFRPEYYGSPEDSMVWELYIPTQEKIKKINLGNGIRLKSPKEDLCIVRQITKKLRDVQVKEGEKLIIENDGTSDCWYVRRDPVISYLHPTQKPIELAVKAINNSSKVMDLVLDPFAGSGFTLLGCEKIQRRARVIELDPGYCATILERYELLTGNKGTKI